MSRILIADDSGHAQRMGQSILAGEGYEVVAVSNGDTALLRLEDVDPDVLLADAIMPGRNGYELCQFVKISPRHKHTRVILTVGAQETLDEAEAKRANADATLRKPFEASALLAAVKPLVEAAAKDRPSSGPEQRQPAGRERAAAPVVALIEPETLRAAVTVALDAAMPHLIEEITQKVLIALTAPERT